jgi:superfamily II DNA or RNA helicase
MAFSVGALVKARGREWVVLPETRDDFLVVRPLGGTDIEVSGIDTALEQVQPASFDLPDPNRLGDYRSCRLLRDAIRLGFRSSAGPFRCFGRIAVEPRPYQLVPLLMALKLDPVRLLIADDVGIGKTVEALLIARELLDRGEIERLTVLCPPHLAEQWQEELRDKFHVDAELVLSNTARRLDRHCGNRSVFDVFPYVVVSLDYIKSESRRADFIRACPKFVIVDEAHTCTSLAQPGRGGNRQQRHQVVHALAKDHARHMLLVTATPHSGNEEGFRSLLSLLSPDFADLPSDLSGEQNRRHREDLARHFVQRRRGDIRRFIETDTAFPERLEQEQTYQLGKGSDYLSLFARLLRYAREVVQDTRNLSKVRQRVRWWAALGLLRALASSPAAAAATLRSKARAVGAETPEEVDEVSRPLVLDEDFEETTDTPDSIPGADTTGIDDADEASTKERERLLEMARAADDLQGDKDPKLLKAVEIVKRLVNDGHRPIVFCRFIATAEYLAEQFRDRLPRGITTIAVTGTIPPEEREKRINELRGLEKYVLVCTDCLSEGINLQHLFDAVVHYDLSWNPTRHEQREGRVDRFGQKRPTVRVVTYYGTDNQIDGVVLDVLIRKHQKIRKMLGVSVPVPTSSNTVLEALYEGLLLRNKDPEQMLLFDEEVTPKRNEFDAEWQNAADREHKSRSLFAQHTLDPMDVAREVASMRAAIGAASDVQGFVSAAVRSLRGTVAERDGVVRIDLSESPLAVREAVRGADRIVARFEPTVQDDEIHLSRTHPIVEGLASFVMDTALDSNVRDDRRAIAARCGVIRTKAVETRTTLLLVRFRYHVLTTIGDATKPLLAEDCQVVAFRGTPAKVQWLPQREAENLLAVEPDENVTDDVARNFVQKVIDDFDQLRSQLDQLAEARGKELLDAHQRVRHAAKRRGVRTAIEPQLPPDVLGLYVYLPVI